MNRALDWAMVITLCASFMYTVSIAFFNEYLLTLGVEPSFIIRNTEQILYHSIFILAETILISGVFFFPLLIICTGIVLVSLVIILRFYKTKKLFVKYKKNKANKKLRKRRIPLSFGSYLDRVIIFILKVFVITLVVVFTMIYFEKKGEKKAHRLLTKIETNQIKESELLTKEGVGKILLISCGTNNCAAIDIESKEIIYFENKITDNTIHSFLREYKEE